MPMEPRNLWHSALMRLESARAADWSKTNQTQAAWEDVTRIEARLFKSTATLQELADKLRYLLSVSMSRTDLNQPVARWPWKQRILMSAIADLDRLQDKLRIVRLNRLWQEAKRCQELIQSMRPLEEMNSELQECRHRLAESQAECNAARSALARFNLGVHAPTPDGEPVALQLTAKGRDPRT